MTKADVTLQVSLKYLLAACIGLTLLDWNKTEKLAIRQVNSFLQCSVFIP